MMRFAIFAENRWHIGMNAGKSIELIKVAYNYEERGKRVLVFTPSIDDRSGVGIVSSRIGIQRDALPISDQTNLLDVFMKENAKEPVDCVLIDECQFLRKHHIQELVEIVDSCDVPVLAYGLKNDFRNELFEGSYYMRQPACPTRISSTYMMWGKKEISTIS